MADGEGYASEEVKMDLGGSGESGGHHVADSSASGGGEVALEMASKRDPLGEEGVDTGVLKTARSYEDAVNKAGETVAVDEKNEKDKPPTPGLMTIVKLFRYATVFDAFLMIIGSIMAVAHGVALPLSMVYFGGIINAFTFQLTTKLVADNFTDGVVNCSSPTFNSLLELIYGTSSNCLDNGAFIDSVNEQIYIYIGIALGTFLASYLQVFFFQLACERQVHKIRLAYYRALLRQNVGWFDANPQGEISSRLTEDLDKIHEGIGDKLSFFLEWTATFFGGFGIGFAKEYRLTLVLLGFTPLLVVSAAIFSKVATSLSSQGQKQYASAAAVAEEVLSSIRTVVAFGGEQKELKRFDKCLKKAKLVGVKKGLIEGVNFGIIYFIIFSVYSVAFWFGGWLISREFTDAGDVLTVFFAVLIGAFSLGQAAPNLGNLVTAAGASAVLYDTIERTPPIDSSSEEGLVPDKFDSTIEFKNVCFSYPTRPELQILNSLNIKLEVGQTLALVGASGCGKSTVVQLLQRFYDIDSGEVLVGGNDVRALNLKWLRKEIGVVSQEPILFDTTIAENIRYGQTSATMDDIKRAATKANVHDFISELPEGYETYVGERGVQMSGGQKQRIAIARALVRDPKILLLDEATSALDAESERIVQNALDSAREGRTTLIIAHRLSTVQNADMIAAVEDGEVVELGTHCQLMELKGLYYELVKAQAFSDVAVSDAVIGDGGGKGSVPVALSRVLSGRGKRGSRRRHRSASSEGDQQQQQPEILERQVSYKRQESGLEKQGGGDPSGKELKRQVSEKVQEQWDKELKGASLFRIMAMNAKEWWMILLGLAGSIVSGAMFPSFAIIFGNIVDVFALPPSEVLAEIHLYAGLFLVLGLVSGIAIFLKSFCFNVAGERLTTRLRYFSFKAMLRQEIGWFDDERNSTGALTTRLSSDASQVQGATGIRLGTLLEMGIGLFVSIIIAFVYSWILTIIILGFVPVILVAGALQAKALTGHATGYKKALEKSGKVAVDSVANIRTVAGLVVEELFYDKYRLLTNVPYKRALWNTPLYGVTYGFSQGVLYFGFVIAFSFGAFQVTRDPGNIIYADFEDVFIVFTALIFGAMSIGQAGAFAPNYAKAKLSANRIFSFLDREPTIDSYSEDGAKPEKFAGQVQFEDVTFKYPTRPDVEVLKGLKFSVEPGKMLALVGPSGCGKSTVVSLIERFYNPIGGTINFDDHEILNLNIQWLRSQIGIVSQEPILFDSSIADNIRYGANFREVSDEEVIEAAKAANIHSFIETLPKSYSTNVGTKGTQLSGGQKQRIAIARALVRDPKILLLDEATSALDTESERVVQEALDKAQKGRTSIVIAHRLSTIQGADHIAVINGGVVLEVGTHQELMERKEFYYKLNKYQMLEEEVSHHHHHKQPPTSP